MNRSYDAMKADAAWQLEILFYYPQKSFQMLFSALNHALQCILHSSNACLTYFLVMMTHSTTVSLPIMSKFLSDKFRMLYRSSISNIEGGKV